MQQESWIAVAIAAISMIGTIAAGLMALLNNRDKLAFDKKVALLEASNIDCAKKHEECEEKTAKLEEGLTRCQEHHEKSDQRFADLSAEIRALKQKD